MTLPLLSVIVTVRDANDTLACALRAILESDLARHDYELIVVDDASCDASSEIAARYADTVVRLTGRSAGSAYARNRGAELAKGEVLVFVDQDEMVVPDTLANLVDLFVADPSLDAVVASHDSQPSSRGILSRYRNALVRFGELGDAGAAGNVGSPCAAIRREVFQLAGMYDEWRFGDVAVEGLELGNRLQRSGRRVMIAPEIKTVSLRRWNLLGLTRDIWERSILVARSLGYQRTRVGIPGDAVFTLTRRLAPAFAIACGTALSAALVPQPAFMVKALVVLAGAIALNFRIYRFVANEAGVVTAIGTAPIHLMMQAVSGCGLCVGWVLRDAIGDRAPDAITQAYAEVGLETWPPVPRASAAK